MRKKLSLELRRELLTRTAEDYASARKGIKSQIVDQLVAATGYGRKHAITLLNHPPGSVSSSRPRRARYDERVKRALVTLWTTANRICAKRLVPFLPELIEVMERNGHLCLPADVRRKLSNDQPRHRRSIIGFGEKQPARFEYDPTGKLAQEADQGPNLR